MTKFKLPSRCGCSDGSEICTPSNVLMRIKEHLAIKSGGHDDVAFTSSKVVEVKGLELEIQDVIPEDIETKRLLEELKQSTGCDSEKCILKRAEESGAISKREHNELQLYFKPKGPTNDKWLTDSNIRNTMKRWVINHPDFYPMDYAMKDYKKYPELYELANTKSSEIYKKGFKCFGCVCNTDITSRGGIHWVSIFCDMRDDNLWTVEFFNSTGRSYKEFIDYTIEAAADLRTISGEIEVKDIMATTKMHQKSNSECGPYALYYIWVRLQKHPHDWFEHNNVPDAVMLEFRKSIFNND